MSSSAFRFSATFTLTLFHTSYPTTFMLPTQHLSLISITEMFIFDRLSITVDNSLSLNITIKIQFVFNDVLISRFSFNPQPVPMLTKLIFFCEHQLNGSVKRCVHSNDIFRRMTGLAQTFRPHLFVPSLFIKLTLPDTVSS